MAYRTGDNMSKVRTFRLVNGDVLIAEDLQTSTEDGVIETLNPAIIFLKTTSEGKTDGVMAPYMPFAKDGRVKVFLAQIASECEPAEKLITEYNRLFGSGLEILTKEEAAQVLKASKQVEEVLQ